MSIVKIRNLSDLMDVDGYQWSSNLIHILVGEEVEKILKTLLFEVAQVDKIMW